MPAKLRTRALGLTSLMTTSSANNSVFKGFFEKQKLTGPNFIDWYRQLRIVLSIEDKLNYLEQPLPHAPVAPEGQQVAPEIIAAHTAWIKGSKEIVGLMLMTMEPEIQRNLENLHAYEMLQELKTLFAQQAEQELLQTTRDFHSCKQEEGQSVSSYVLKMKGYIDNLEHLEHPVTLGLTYLAELLNKKKNATSGVGGSSIFAIELNTFLNRSWIYDTGCGTYICNTTQGLKASRKLTPGALSLYMGNGQREAVDGNLIDGKSISSERRPYGGTMLSTRAGKFRISIERKQLRHALFLHLFSALGSPWDFLDHTLDAIDGYRRKIDGLDKFEGVDFQRWQKKMNFLLSSMSVVYVLTTPILEDGGDDATVEQIRKRAKWDNDDYNVEFSKELKDSLEAKYMAEDASSKKFLVNNFTNYKMIDSRPVMEQYNELLDFKHTLKHLKEELTLVELGSHLHIKKSLRMQDSDKPKGNNVVGPSVVNMVEHNNSSRYNDNKGKHKHHDNTKANPNKKSKVNYWKCGKPRHLKKDCKGEKVSNKANGSDINGSVDGSTNLLKGPTVHVCKDRCRFKTYELLNDGSILHMGNKSIALVQGCGYVDLRVVVRLLDPKLKTLGERGIECIFVGYVEHSKAFRIPHGTEDIGGSVVPEKITDEDDPKTFDEAMKSQDVAFWKEAINDEMDSIMGNNTWVLADLPPGCKPLG
ncbi:hypothetical protein Tco_0370055 [Tanacetum coccineum]